MHHLIFTVLTLTGFRGVLNYRSTTLQHVPEKEAIVDNGAHFEPLPGTENGVIPPAIQHLSVSIGTGTDTYQAVAQWDTPRIVKGCKFILRLTTGAGTADDPTRLVTSATISETQFSFNALPRGDYELTVRAMNGFGQQGAPTSTRFSIQVPEAPTSIEVNPGYFQITIIPHQTYYRADVQYEFWFSDKRITDYRLIESTALKLGISSYWVKDRLMKLGTDYYFYVRSVNQVGKSNFVEAVGQVSSDANGYLDFFKGKITESYLGKELLGKVDLTTDNASRLTQFEKEWTDVNNKWNAMWGVKIEQTKDGKHYVAGLGLSMEDTPEGKLSQFLVAANRIEFIDPANGNTTPMLVGYGNQLIMNDVLLKRLYAASITSSGNPPTFSVTPEGKLTARNADITGVLRATSGTFSNVVIDSTCDIKYLRAESIDGDITKTYVVNKNGTVTIPAQRFVRKMILPSVVAGTYGHTTQSGGSNPSDKWYSSTSMAEITVNGSRVGVVAGPSISTWSTGQFLNTGSVLYTIPANTSIIVGMNHKMTDYSTPSSFDYINPMAVIFVFKE